VIAGLERFDFAMEAGDLLGDEHREGEQLEHGPGDGHGHEEIDDPTIDGCEMREETLLARHA
jgi:hypothetical protein